jgi:hypothetical protein
MKRIDLPALLLGSLLTSLCAIPPAVAATMSEVSVFYQPPTSSAGRQPRTGSGGQLVTVPNSSFPLGGPLSGPSTSAPTNAEPTISVGTTTYNLAFISISGGAAGGITVFPGANIFSVAVPLQDPPQNILVENVYFPTGVGPPCPPNTVCGSGASIDEFSETLGTLVDDTFVNVFAPPASPNPNVMVTKTANASGSVNTTNQSVRISAISPAKQFENTPTGGNFDRWTTGHGGAIGGSGNRDLTVNQDTDDDALALYRANCPTGFSLSPPTSMVSQCVQIKITCPPGEGSVENGNGLQCVAIAKCPAACGPEGCIVVPAGVPPNNKPGDTQPIFACKNKLNGGNTLKK